MPLDQVIVSKSIECLVEATINKCVDFFKKIKKENPEFTITENLPKLFSLHYIEVLNWSSDIPFIGLSKQKKVFSSTIELSISPKISKYNSKGIVEEIFTEMDIINLGSNIVILGKPGAGKTTTIKRIIQKFFSHENSSIPFTNPILLRLRELNEGSSIYTEVLDIFEIPWEVRAITTTKIVNKPNGDYYPVETTVHKTFLKNSDRLVENFLPTFLNETNAILFLDGYDELHESLQKKMLTDIEKVALKLDGAKIILTSRTSSFSKILQRFSIFEINPLSTESIYEIASKWLDNGDDFFKLLNKRKYSDLANRPIFLTLLLILFDKNYNLPLSPFEVYREAVFLIIRDWDEQRGITRRSKYGNFDVRKKLDFLQEVSLFLTYQLKSNIFSSNQLEAVYILIHKKYELPKEDMYNVIREIESHNGLISEIGHNAFEFSHLSLQEYLCAESLITLPYSKNTIVYFFERPDPLAIAVCISKDSGLWLANLLLNENLSVQHYTDKKRFEFSLTRFFSRLIDENPRFNESTELGLVVIYLMSKFHKSADIFQLILQFVEIDNVKESIILALGFFESEKNYVQNRFKIVRTKVISTEAFISIPLRESIDLTEWGIFEKVINSK